MKTQSKFAPPFAAGRNQARRKGSPVRPILVAAVLLVTLALLVATCNFFSSPSGPSAPPPSGSSPASSGTPLTGPATASPSGRFVKTITLVAPVIEPKDATPSGLTWKGLQAAGAQAGASTSLVVPASNADLPSAVGNAAAGDLAVVVTIGPQADPAVQAAAAAHPAAQFFEVDVAVPETSPPNVHGIVFDEAEVGYLAGFVAGSFSDGSKIGFVGDVAADLHTANYVSGFQSGASQAGTGIGVKVAYVGTGDSPDKGRTAAAGLVSSGTKVVSAMSDLSGIGALREACGSKARLVTLDTDAWQVVPDLRPCLIASVLKRYDVAVGNVILLVAAGQTPSAVTLEDVSTGGIAVSDFHADMPSGFDGQLAGVLAALKNGAPHPTMAPATVSPRPSAH